jgi:hypothetical protein
MFDGSTGRKIQYQCRVFEQNYFRIEDMSSSCRTARYKIYNLRSIYRTNRDNRLKKCLYHATRIVYRCLVHMYMAIEEKNRVVQKKVVDVVIKHLLNSDSSWVALSSLAASPTCPGSTATLSTNVLIQTNLLIRIPESAFKNTHLEPNYSVSSDVRCHCWFLRTHLHLREE